MPRSLAHRTVRVHVAAPCSVSAPAQEAQVAAPAPVSAPALARVAVLPPRRHKTRPATRAHIVTAAVGAAWLPVDMPRHVLRSLGLSLLLVACGDPLLVVDDAGSPPSTDAGPPGNEDASPPRAVDAGPAADGGAPTDAGVGTDAGPPASDDEGAVTDVLLMNNDGDYEHLNIEISPDQRWATLNERDRVTLDVHPMLFSIDDRGELVERCFYEDVSLRANSSMQFGEANGRAFAVGFDEAGRNMVVLRPSLDATCDAQRSEVPLGVPEGTPSNELRNPYPMRGGEGPAWVVFHQHANASDTETLWVQDIDSEAPATPVWSGMRPNSLRGFATFASVARWVPGRAVFLAGRWRDGVIQAYLSDVSGDAPVSEFATLDPMGKPDLSPFLSGDGAYLFSNDDGGPHALVYRQGADGRFERFLEVPFDATQSTILGRPAGAISLEAFEWGGELYASYQIADAEDRAPGCRGVNCMFHELWIAAFERAADGAVTGVRHACRVSAPAEGVFRGKVDPEPVVAGARLRVYYHRSDLTRMPGRPGNQLAVLTMEDRLRFDAACAAGVAGPE